MKEDKTEVQKQQVHSHYQYFPAHMTTSSGHQPQKGSRAFEPTTEEKLDFSEVRGNSN